VHLAVLVLAVALVAAPGGTEAQQTSGVPRIGYLGGGRSGTPDGGHLIEAFRKGLRDLGWVEGQSTARHLRRARALPLRDPPRLTHRSSPGSSAVTLPFDGEGRRAKRAGVGCAARRFAEGPMMGTAGRRGDTPHPNPSPRGGGASVSAGFPTDHRQVWQCHVSCAGGRIIKSTIETREETPDDREKVA
jgi:hypothetical protein